MAEWNYKSAWDESVSLLKKEIGDEEYGIWFGNVEYISSEETVIYASVQSNFFLKEFSTRYLQKIIDKVSELAGKNLSVSLIVPKKEEKKGIPPPEKPAEEEKNTSSGEKPRSVTAVNKIPGEKKKINAQLQEEYTFDTYVVGEINSYAYNAANAVAKNPGTSKIYNPLLIYGGTGLGKTHLMQAIGHYIHQNSELKILYITGEGFMHEFVEVVGLGQKNKDAFAKKYRNVDALLIDDIHNISAQAISTQDELFYTFEALKKKKKQMVFT
jgi:chromosomal replication initiator protein